MSIYSELQKVAGDILTEFDQKNITLIQKTYNSETPDEPSETSEVRHSLRGVGKGVSQYFEKNGFVSDSDGSITTSVLAGVTPTINDFLEVNGIVFKILKFEPVPRVGVPCVWKFIVRKGG